MAPVPRRLCAIGSLLLQMNWDNAIARGMITQRSNTVVVVISKLTSLYYPEMFVQLTQQFSEHDVR
jgi:DNA-binding LacI/PurR family transcriptional regulator